MTFSRIWQNHLTENYQLYKLRGKSAKQQCIKLFCNDQLIVQHNYGRTGRAFWTNLPPLEFHSFRKFFISYFSTFKIHQKFSGAHKIWKKILTSPPLFQISKIKFSISFKARTFTWYIICMSFSKIGFNLVRSSRYIIIQNYFVTCDSCEYKSR